jgi:putative endonuclease
MTGFRRSDQAAQQLGRIGEQTAADYLIERGYRIRERNFRCRFGEIDLVAESREYLVFVEVKARLAAKRPISPLISLTRRKRERLRAIGEVYWHQNKLWDRQPRFDVIGITFTGERQFDLEHIENAF